MSSARIESKALIRLAIPILLTQLGQIGMGTVDTIMSGYVSTLDLAAIAIGTSLWTPVWLLLAGILVALSPLAASMAAQQTSQQPNNNEDALPTLLSAALWAGAVSGLIASALLIASSWLLPWIVQDAATANIASQYLLAIAIGFPAAGVFLAFRFYAEALNQATSVTRIMLLGLLLNVPANGLFVYGWFGLPELGGVGCGIGSSLIFIGMAIAIAIDTRKKRLPDHFPLLQSCCSPEKQLVKRIFQIGFPIGLAIFFEVSLFSVVALFLTSLGPVVVAAHQVAINVATMVFMLPLSLGMALTVRVSHHLGSQNHHLARQAAWLGVRINLGVGLFNALLMAILAPPIAGLYSPDSAVVALGANLLLYAAVFQLSDATQVSCAAALRGYQDTLAIMVVTFVAYWVFGLGSGYWLAFIGISDLSIQPMGAEGLWTGLIIGLSCAGGALLWRLNLISRNQPHQNKLEADSQAPK